MNWERPDFVEIAMNAEIGGYQSDYGDTERPGPRKPTAGQVAETGAEHAPGAPQAP
jgi:hypothetical protein